MSRTLTAVRRAQTRHALDCAAAWDRYLTAIRNARHAGHTLREIGEAVGVSAQAVHYLLNGDPRKRQP